MLRWRRKVIGVKIESSYGVDPVPTGAANAILTRDVSISPLEMDYEDRSEIDTGYAGHKGEIIAGQHVKMAFKVDIAGAGAAGDVPGYGPLLKAAGCSETVNAGVSVVYAPVHPGSGSSVTTYFWLDGVLHSILGQLADCELNFPKGRAPFYQFNLMGLFVGPSDVAVATPTLSAFQKPVAVNLVNTTPMTLHSYAGKFSNLTLRFGNQLVYRNLPNSEAIRWVDRKSTGAAKLEKELVAAKAWYTIMKAGTLGALAVTHGQSAGNQVVIAAANVQLTRPAIDVEDTIAMKNMQLTFQPSSAGNDEWSITVK